MQARVLLAVGTLVALGLAWSNRFLQDDAYIVFHYARNLAEGRGLTWFGERIEGYTDFLWVLWIRLGILFRADPPAWSQFGGLLALVWVLHSFWHISRRLFEPPLVSFAALLLLATNHTFSSFATGGLETMLQTALLCGAVRRSLDLRDRDRPGAGSSAAISLTLAGAILTRMDSAVIAAPVGGWTLVHLIRRRASRAVLAGLIAPGAGIVGGWLIWKLGYYGHLLPNTYQAKVPDGLFHDVSGLLYVRHFFQEYWLWPVPGLALVSLVARRSRVRPPPGIGLLTTIAIAWLLYVAAVGGDFMEFRMLVPGLPFLILVLFWLVVGPIGKGLVRHPLATAATVTALLVVGSVQHGRSFAGIRSGIWVDSLDELSTFYGVYPEERWDAIGTKLGQELADADPILALDAVGAIPYFSRLRTVDMWGLNDRVVPREGTVLPESNRRPGHRRHATLSYLKERGVHLVIGHPTVVDPADFTHPRWDVSLARWTREIAIGFNREDIGVATLVAMPLEEGRSLMMWNLTPSPALDEAIEERGWLRRRVKVPDVPN
jgi:hypothetical protein